MDTQERISRIRKYERVGRALHLDPEARRNLQQETLRFSNDFLDSIEDLSAFNGNDYDRPSFPDGIFTEEGSDLSGLLEYLDEHVHKSGINAASGKHLGFIPGGGLFASALGDYLAAVFNRYAGVFFATPGAVKMENALIRWSGHVMGYRGDFAGNLASGGSIANLIAITTARTSKGIRGKDYESTVIYLSHQTHHCVLKDLRVAGLDECILRVIPFDERFRLRADVLRKQIEADVDAGLSPFLIIGNAGTTDTGAIDPLNDMADIAEKHNIWFHVDGAYGGYFMLTDHGKEKMTGIERADSIVIDPHKALFLPFGLGIVLVKSAKEMRHAHDFQANYMQDVEKFNQVLSPAEVSPELTKHFRGLRMWLPLKLHGVSPFRAALNEKLELARYFYERIKELGYETGPEPELSVVLFRHVAGGNKDINETNEKILRKVQEDGDIFISSTTIDGVFWLRVAILSFRTHLEEIDRFLDKLAKY